MTENEITDFYKNETAKLLHSIGKEKISRLMKWEFCEADNEFVAFLENYIDLRELPVDYTIIDIGSCQSFQADYFKSFRKYIGVEPDLAFEYRLEQENAEYYDQNAQDFIAATLPSLIKEGLDLNKTFAICSAVPDKKARLAVEKTFPYYRIAYPGQKPLQSYPEEFHLSSRFFTEDR
jgi:hypothetical protein